jgi:hypothetical protein
MSLQSEFDARMAARNQEDRGFLDDLIQHPCCAILPSPEKLKKGSSSPGQDETNTRGDFDKVWQWLTSSDFLNTGFYVDVKETVDQGGQLEEGIYTSVIRLAFGNAFDPIRNTSDPEQGEMVLLYYAGHGLSEQGATNLKEANLITSKRSLVSPFPRLGEVGFSNPEEHFAAAESFLTPNRTVKGGELCLHDVGFCDLQGLLKPWIAAVKGKSINPPHDRVKKNKHLVVVADSCYSGKLVEDLEQLALTPGPWKEHGCTVTVQSASSSDEPTFGGYFTPCFVHFNKPENQGKLQKLKQKWDEKSEIEKNAYRAVDLPSPQVATTMPSEKLRSGEDDPILVLPRIQGVQLTLFRDAGFFKFCFLSFSGIVGSKARALTPVAANTFLSQDNFDILDYKLKTISNGTPMALVLVEDPRDTAHVVCVHIHFHNNSDTSNLRNVSGVNLINHNRPTNVGDLFLQDSDPRKYQFWPGNAARYRHLVERCKNYVNRTDPEPGRWDNASRWNMRHSLKGKFRLKERSDWMDKYVEKMVSENSQTS